jgi:hypothetical protein
MKHSTRQGKQQVLDVPSALFAAPSSRLVEQRLKHPLICQFK